MTPVYRRTKTPSTQAIPVEIPDTLLAEEEPATDPISTDTVISELPESAAPETELGQCYLAVLDQTQVPFSFRTEKMTWAEAFEWLFVQQQTNMVDIRLSDCEPFNYTVMLLPLPK